MHVVLQGGADSILGCLRAVSESGRGGGGRGERGLEHGRKRRERGGSISLDLGVVRVGLLLWTVVLVSTSSAVPEAHDLEGRQRGGRGGESGREKGTLSRG